MVGASRTSPVPGSGMRRRHARRRILPSFRALRGDNTPTAALRGLRMITRWTSSYTMLLELFGGRRKKGTASLLLLLVWCLELAKGPTLCMGAPGGLYRPTPRGYNGNPTGHGAQPSVTALAGFCAGCWGPPTGGPLVDRQAPLSRTWSAAGYCCSILVTWASSW